MSRWKAAAIHLIVSIAIVIIMAGLLLATWYPPRLLQAVGGLGLMGILAGVDACIGPLLTLIVFKADKPGLKFDLAVIAVLQLFAAGYGLYTMYEARPVFMLFAMDRFELVSAAEIPPGAPNEATYKEYKLLSLSGPVIAAVRRPTDPKEREKMLFELMPQGLDYKNFPKYYVPYPEMAKDAISRGVAASAWKPGNADAHAALDKYLIDHNLQASMVKLLPLHARNDQTVVINGESGEILGLLAVDPW